MAWLSGICILSRFTPTTTGHYFDSEWGFIDSRPSGTHGDWIEYDVNHVTSKIYERAQNPDFTKALEIPQIGNELFEAKRDEIISILEISKQKQDDSFLNDLIIKAKQIEILSGADIIKQKAPSNVATRDSLAASQGIWIPPHIIAIAFVSSIRNPIAGNKLLTDIARKAISHIERININKLVDIKPSGTKVFIGHGRSPAWKDLQYFVQNRLKLEHDEFNRVPVAGITTIDRLSEMLDAASIAFLVLTAEDEQSDGKLQARMNVIHESGLFQGRLGFKKAIILLEEGCEEFSNIHGLSHIHFPQGNIKASFEEIRSVIEREGILP
ncbi:MAG: TIR domain-containing protein [Chloroflexota bacterium]